jgi:hypothetical protein
MNLSNQRHTPLSGPTGTPAALTVNRLFLQQRHDSFARAYGSLCSALSYVVRMQVAAYI